jgi:flagellar biosynthesis protein FlhG
LLTHRYSDGYAPALGDQAQGLRDLSQGRTVSVVPPAASRVRCVAIGSGKGGVGKTVVSVGLAMALSERGKRVLLFDGDMGLANVDLQMGLIPEYTVQDVIFGDCELEKACIRVEGGPDVLVSASGSPELVDMTPARRQLFIEQLYRFASQYDFFLIDTGAGIGRGSTDFLEACPEVLVVLTDEPTSLMDAYALIKTLHMRGQMQALGVIVNMVDSIDAGERVFGRLNQIASQFLGVSLFLAGILVYDRRVSDAIKNQQSIVRYASGGAVARCLRDLAQQFESKFIPTQKKLDYERWVAQWEASAFLMGPAVNGAAGGDAI